MPNPEPCFAALDYFWDREGTPPPTLRFYAPQCRMKFFLLGNAKMGDLLNAPYAEVLDWCLINLRQAPVYSTGNPFGLVEGVKKGKILSHLQTLKSRLKKNPSTGNAYASLRDMLKDATLMPDLDGIASTSMPDPDNPDRPRAALKKLGVILPFDQAINYTDESGAEHTKGSIADEIDRDLKDFALIALLNGTAVKNYSATIEKGKKAQIFRPSFSHDEVPTVTAPIEFTVGPNGKCCGTMGCQSLPNSIKYCQLVNPNQPFHETNNPCNSISDHC